MRTRWMTILGFAIATVLILWLFRNDDPADVWASIRDGNFGLLGLAVLVTTAVFPVRAIRWRYFLAPAQAESAKSPFRSRFAAVCVGFMANNLLPVRMGEITRAYAYSRLEPMSTATALATLVVERFLDGVAILLLLLVALATPDFPSGALPGNLVGGIRWLSLVLAVILFCSLVLLVFPDRSLRATSAVAHALLPTRIAGGAIVVTENVVAGLASLRGWRLLLPAFAWSLVVWALQSLSFWIGFFAFGIDLPFAAAIVTNAAVALAVAVPSAPGFVGTFHAGAKLALTDVYGVAAVPALGFAFGWHLGGFFPVTFMGLWYAHRIGLSMRDLRESGRKPGSPAEPRGRGSPAP